MTDAATARTVPFRRDGEALRAACVSFVRSAVDDADTDGVVVELDGGLESSVVATVAVDALGPERVYGLVLPSSKLGSWSAQDAEAIASGLGIESDTIHLQPLLMWFGDLAPDATDLSGDPILRRNLVARLRTATAYLVANASDRLVVGSATRTELLLGSITKYGETAADLFPIGGLYGPELDALAEALDLPEFVTDPPATAVPYPGDEGRYGVDALPDAVDAVLYRFVESGWSPERVRADLDVEGELVDRILDHHRATEHKRRRPPVGPADA
jgi:NAD+ synthase